jgi:hypothetical protein
MIDIDIAATSVQQQCGKFMQHQQWRDYGKIFCVADRAYNDPASG